MESENETKPKTILTNAIKNEFLSEIVNNEATSFDVARRFPIHSGSVRKLHSKQAKGKLIYDRDGRPPKIDSESHGFIVEYMYRNPEFSAKELREVIKSETWNTFRRKHGDLLITDRRIKNCASYATIAKYMNRYNAYRFHFTVNTNASFGILDPIN
jgi:hypothetical protein